MYELSMCRICLEKDLHMHSILHTPLQEIYESLTAMPFETSDIRPIQVCYICHARLQNCYKLRMNCLRSEGLFHEMLINNVLQPELLEINPKMKLAIQHAIATDNLTASQIQDNNIKKEPMEFSYEVKQESLEDVGYQMIDNEADCSITNVEFTHNIETPVKIEPQDLNIEDDTCLNQMRSDQSINYIEADCNAQWREYIEFNNFTMPSQEISVEDSTSLPVPMSYNAQYITSENTQGNVSTETSLKIGNNKKRLTNGQKKRYKCDVCEKCFSQKFELMTHTRIHTGEKPFKCTICEHCFSQKHHLDRHHRIHTGEKPFKCDVCKKTFRLKHHLDKHILTHTGEKPYKCHICEHCFCQKHHLDKHIRVHTGEKPYRCDICKKCFSQKGRLDVHIRIHTGEKPYRCDVCKKCFRVKPHLDKHIRKHTGEKPFKCTVCEKCFSQKVNLDKHSRTHNRAPVSCY